MWDDNSMGPPSSGYEGLLGPLQGLLSQFGNNQADKDQALQMGLLAFGSGLMGAKKGRAGKQAGNAILSAMNAYQGTLANASQSKNAAMGTASNALQLRSQLQSIQEAQREGEVESRYIPMGYTTGGSMSPTTENATNLRPAGVYEQLMHKAQFYAEQKMPRKAQEYYLLAEKYKPKFSQKPEIGMDPTTGQPYQFVLDDSGNEKRISAQPTAKFREINDGKTTRLVNEYSLPSSGVSTTMQTTPGQDQSSAQWAQDYQLRVNADRRAAAGGGGQKPQLVNGQWVYPPDAQNPSGRAVTPTGLVAGEGKPLTESQAKATAFVNQMQNASGVIDELASKGFDGKTSVQQAQIVNAGGQGVPYMPGTGMAQRAMAGAKAQQYQQAELQWTEGALRFMTGANAPEQEVIRNAATYFPRPGDSDAVIERKKAARLNMEQSVRMAAGHGSDKVPQREASRPGKTVVQTGTEKGTGRKVVKYSDGTVVYQ